MTIRYPCKQCDNDMVTIVYRGLVTVMVKCTKCFYQMQVEKTRIKLLETSHD